MLYQFSQAHKKPDGTINEDELDDIEDDGLGGTEDEMDGLLDDDDIEGEEEDEDADLDLDQQASNDAEIEELAREVERSLKLLKAQINHGRFSIMKVCLFSSQTLLRH